MVYVGYGMKDRLVSRMFPAQVGTKKPRAWLDVYYHLRMDEDGKYLTVQSSFFGVYATEDRSIMLCHYDYERDKEHYTEAHVQVYGRSPALER